jgi:hypothetical protein
MGEGFLRGAWGDGSHGDPGPDVLLPAVTAEDLLNGHLLLVPGEFRPLADTVTALGGPPSAAELRGEAQARAAFRALRSGTLDEPGVSSHTLPLALRAANGSSRGRRTARARHRSTESTRPRSRREAGGRLGLVSGVAAVVIAAVVGLAYAGGVFSARVNTVNVAEPPSGVRPSDSASQSAGVAGVSASPTPAGQPTPTGAAGASNASADMGQALCRAWLQNPWQPGVKNWDDDDFNKLSTLAHGPQMVLMYCWKILPRDYWGAGPALHYPQRYSNGHWAWVPDDKPPAPGNVPSQGGDPGAGNGNSGPNAGPQSRH